MDLVTDLDIITTEASQRADDYDAFGYYVELQEISDAEFDALAERVAEPIVAEIDCTECANCCRSLDVFLTLTDATRLSSVVPLQDILDYEHAASVDEWACFKAKPCPLLNGKLCTVYEQRPDACRAYPTFTPDFRWTIRDILGGVGFCPIIYNVIEHLQRELAWR